MEGYLGQLMMFAGSWAPRGWAFCEGQILPISSFNGLYSIIGNIYGGDERTTFALPDLRGRTPVGENSNPIHLGQKGGTETHQLKVSELPAHDHGAVFQSVSASGTVNPSAYSGRSSLTNDPTGNYPAKVEPGNEIYSKGSDVEMGQSKVNITVSDVQMEIGETGGNQSFSMMNPFLGINWIICYVGFMPSRN